MEKERIENVRKMEDILNKMNELQEKLTKAVDEWHQALPEYRQLVEYYSNPQWQKDYDASNKGLFPEDLPQGVLSEDAIYEVIGTQQDLGIHLVKVGIEAVEKA